LGLRCRKSGIDSYDVILAGIILGATVLVSAVGTALIVRVRSLLADRQADLEPDNDDKSTLPESAEVVEQRALRRSPSPQVALP
jgi:hypothetical protein